MEATTAESTSVARTIWLRDETPDVSSDDDTNCNPATTPAEPDQLTGDNPVRQAGDPDQSPTLAALIQIPQSMATQTQALTATVTQLVVQRNLLDPPAAGNNADTALLAGTSNPAVHNQVFPNAWGKVYSISGVTIGTCVGVHPHMVNNYIPWNRLEAIISGPRCVGVGECGLDATVPELEPQKELLCQQVLLAKQTGLPLDLHVQDDKDSDSPGHSTGTPEGTSRPGPPALCPLLLWRQGMAQKFISFSSNTLFSLSWASVRQPTFCEYATQVRIKCLALETDALHLPLPSYTAYSPFLL